MEVKTALESLPGSKRVTPRRLKNIVRFLGKRLTFLIGLGIILGILSMGFEVLLAYTLQATLGILGNIGIDGAIMSVPDWFPTRHISKALLLLFLCGLLRGVAQFSLAFLQGLSFESLRTTLRTRLIHWVYREDSVDIGKFLALFHDYLGTASLAMSYLQLFIVGAALAFATLLFLLSISIKMTLFLVLAVGIGAFLMRGFFTSIEKSSQTITAATDEYSRLFYMNLKNIFLLRIYGTADDEETKTVAAFQTVKSASVRNYFMTASKFGSIQVLGISVVCTMIYIQSKYKPLNTSQFIPYLYLFVRFVQTVAEMMKNFAAVLAARPQLAKLYQWWISTQNEPAMKLLPAGKEDRIVLNHPVGWAFSNVDFQYPISNKKTIERATFQIDPGSCVVILGHSGSGKTTLLNLMMGVLRPTSGKIQLIGIQQEKFDLEDCYRSFLRNIGYVGPESFIISGSLRENLIYGSLRIPSDVEILEALRLAECDFIRDIKQPLDYRLSDQGHGLSAGQKQRLSLARALLRNPKILILDEPTSNLDHDTELKLVQTFRRLVGNMTIVIVTHHESLRVLGNQLIHMGTQEKIEPHAVIKESIETV